jgi:hypothetical protein
MDVLQKRSDEFGQASSPTWGQEAALESAKRVVIEIDSA